MWWVWGVFFFWTNQERCKKNMTWMNLIALKFSTVFLNFLYRKGVIFKSCFKHMHGSSHAWQLSTPASLIVLQSLFNNASALWWHPASLTSLAFRFHSLYCNPLCKFYIILLPNAVLKIILWFCTHLKLFLRSSGFISSYLNQNRLLHRQCS